VSAREGIVERLDRGFKMGAAEGGHLVQNAATPQRVQPKEKRLKAQA
jgi:hypothetical protein